MKETRCKMRAVLAVMICVFLLMPACTAPSSVVVITPMPGATATSAAAQRLHPEPPGASVGLSDPDAQTLDRPAEPQEPAIAVRVRAGDTLERDIIPQLCAVFGLDTDVVKNALAEAQSWLIDSELEGFRRMEGIIVPGEYAVAGETLAEYINIWMEQAEERFDNVGAACGGKNGLKPHEQLTLASIVEWECIGSGFEDEVAAAFLNRLDDNAKLRSCATTEYALGYQRPYLTSDDIAVKHPYNTYQVRGLPPGPICTVDNDSLAAGISPAVDKKIYYFFYDYALHTMEFFYSYDEFKAAASESARLFEQAFDFDRYDKVDKRAVFDR